MQTLALTESERLSFTRAVEWGPNPYGAYNKLAPLVGDIFRGTIRKEICDALRDFSQEQRIHALFLQNCPTAENPGPTPNEDRMAPEKGFLEEYFLLGATEVQGTRLYHDRKERHGESFLNIMTLPGYEKESSSRGRSFQWHTEHVHLPKTINFVDLLCVKGDPNAFTSIFSAEGLVKGAPDWVVAGMKKKNFKMQTGPSWPHMKIESIQPILGEDRRNNLTIRFNSDFANRLTPINEEGRRVLDYLSGHLKKIETVSLSLKPRECLFLNNKRAVHRRNFYLPSTSHEARRWLVGAYKMLAR
jgi:hypothetical protein